MLFSQTMLKHQPSLDVILLYTTLHTVALEYDSRIAVEFVMCYGTAQWSVLLFKVKQAVHK